MSVRPLSMCSFNPRALAGRDCLLDKLLIIKDKVNAFCEHYKKIKGICILIGQNYVIACKLAVAKVLPFRATMIVRKKKIHIKNNIARWGIYALKNQSIGYIYRIILANSFHMPFPVVT